MTLLEAQKDFDRNFRGDTVNPNVLEIMDQLGLAERLLELPHAKISKITLRTPTESVLVTDYAHLRSRHRFVMVLPQVQFLNFVVAEARRYPNFRVLMNAHVTELIEEGGSVCGVRYRDGDAVRDLRSSLVVGADGRSSTIRRLAGFELEEVSKPVFEVLWFRLERSGVERDDVNLGVFFGTGYYFAITDRLTHWQMAIVVPRGSFRGLREQGLDVVRRWVTDLVPAFSRAVQSLTDWNQVFVLQVGLSMLRRWYKLGLLLIGDAAHVMSSVGGVGISCAIQDAVVAHNELAAALLRGSPRESDLARVQRKRRLVTLAMQKLQGLSERRLVARALDSKRPFRIPFTLRLPIMRWLTAQVIGRGVWPVRLEGLRAGATVPQPGPPTEEPTGG